jgi:hypothetical protein
VHLLLREVTRNFKVKNGKGLERPNLRETKISRKEIKNTFTVFNQLKQNKIMFLFKIANNQQNKLPFGS